MHAQNFPNYKSWSQDKTSAIADLFKGISSGLYGYLYLLGKTGIKGQSSKHTTDIVLWKSENWLSKTEFTSFLILHINKSYCLCIKAFIEHTGNNLYLHENIFPKITNS